MLREQVQDTGANDSLYLSALVKLAPKNASFRKELTDYAEASLRAGRGDARQQLTVSEIRTCRWRLGISATTSPFVKY